MDTRADAPSAASPPPAIDCDHALRLIQAQATTSLPTHLTAMLRGHLAVCPECKSAYRERMQAVASLGRQLRTSQTARGRRLGGAHFHRRLGSRSLRRFAMFVVPAALFFLATRLDSSWSFEPTLTVETLQGTTWIAGRALEPSGGALRLGRSDLLETPPDARCRVEARAFALEVEAEARLLVVSGLTKRLRLEEGALRATGEVTLETPLGLVEVEDGEADVRVDGAGLVVIARSGSVRRVDASGRRIVPVESDASVGL